MEENVEQRDCEGDHCDGDCDYKEGNFKCHDFNLDGDDCDIFVSYDTCADEADLFNFQCVVSREGEDDEDCVSDFYDPEFWFDIKYGSSFWYSDEAEPFMDFHDYVDAFHHERGMANDGDCSWEKVWRLPLNELEMWEGVMDECKDGVDAEFHSYCDEFHA